MTLPIPPADRGGLVPYSAAGVNPSRRRREEDDAERRSFERDLEQEREQRKEREGAEVQPRPRLEAGRASERRDAPVPEDSPVGRALDLFA